MNSETKLFLGIILSTVVIIAGAAFVFSRPVSVPTIDPALLVRQDSHKVGSPSATITLVEFGDFQCPACSAYHTVVKQLQTTFKESMTLVFRQFPLSSHKNAMPAALASEAAGKQGKFWEMYDKLYETQKDWSTDTDTKSRFEGYAKDIGLNVNQFTKDMQADEAKKRIEADIADATTIGVDSTPSFYLNNEKIENPRSLAEFETLIRTAIEKAPKPTEGKAAEGDYHIHANIKVIIDGTLIDFSQEKYQSQEGKELHPYIHFHDGIGDMFHVHKQGMTMGDLFTSIGMKLTPTCITDDRKIEYCERSTAPGAFLYMWVNGKENNSYAEYVPQDLDRILVVYDSKGDTVRQGTGDALISSYVKSVSDTACIYSEKCPERGTPPTENCVGGLGTDCK